ncbi:hypothetical protein DDW08_02745 [Vulcanisaeta sp. SCGC AB-777_J10]|nr:hypothetical protein DDW08_02745 [Vulcanisaeta sp. SCGC AB-777_J10]
MAMSTPTLNLNKLPPIFVSKLLNAFFARFLAGGGLEYDEVHSIIKCVDCKEFKERLISYVNSDELNNVLSRLFQPIDGFSSGVCLKGKGMAKVQDLIRSLINDKLRIEDVFEELGSTEIRESGDIGGVTASIKWGRQIHGWIPGNLTPPVISSVDFMEGVRSWPQSILNVVEKHGRRKAVEVRAGTYKNVEVSCLVYALVALAYASSAITKFGRDTYLFLIPMTLNRDLIVRFTNARSKLSKSLRDINIDAVPEHLYHLLVASAVRVWNGAVELVWAESGGGRNFMVTRELVVDLSNYKPLVETLIVNDEEGLFTEFVAQVIRDYTSNDKDRVDRAKPFVDVLRGLLMVALGVGNTEQALYDALLTLRMIKPEQVGDVGIYKWALARLRKIVQTTYEKTKYAIA